MKLRITCKQLNKLLTCQVIGDFCKRYNLEDKNKTLSTLLNTIITFTTADNHYKNDTNIDTYQKLLTIVNDINDSYNTARLPILILLYSGADANSKNTSHSLAETATRHHDIELIKILFQHHADPNTESIEFNNPIFFYAQTIEMIELFINNGVDLHAAANNHYQPNVLWAIMSDTYPANLFEFYLNHQIDPTKQHPQDNSCLLHKLASEIYITEIDEFLKKATLLLKKIPHMINFINKKGQTPLNIAQDSLKLAQLNAIMPEAFEKLIVLFKNHGCLTIEELIQKDESFGCLICMQAEEKDMLTLSCVNPHTASICQECYKRLHLCPLCRNPLIQKNNKK